MEPPVEAAEEGFVRHGLPYFVDSEREAARAGMQPGRLVTVLGVALVVGVAAGVLVGVFLDSSIGVGTAMVVAGALVALYAATTLRMTAMARWAVARTLGSLGLLFPLVTRALPLLLIFSSGQIPFLDAVNLEIIASEIVATLVGSIGLIAAVPITTALAALLAVRMTDDEIAHTDTSHGHAH